MAPTSPIDDSAPRDLTGAPGEAASRNASDQHAAAAPGAASGQSMRVTYRGAIITVTAHQNAEQAWIADVSITLDGRPMSILPELQNAEPVTPEWVNESEALRAGVERGRYLIDRTLRETSPHLAAEPQGRPGDRR